MAALRTLWTAMVGLYEETLILVAGNLAWVALNLPIFVLTLLIGLPFVGSSDEGGMQWLLVVVAWLLLFLPSPATVGLGGLTRVAAGPDVPGFGLFRQTLRTHWRLALKCFTVSLVVTVALVANVYFYAVQSTGWLRFASILWLYGVLLWLSLHVYLVPLMVHLPEPRLLDLYRRAALIAVGHPGYTLVLLVLLLAIGLLCIVFLPAYVLVCGAYVSLAQAHALREIRRRHGDLVVEPDEEVSRL